MTRRTFHYLSAGFLVCLLAGAGLYAFRSITRPKKVVYRAVYTQNPPYYSSDPGQPPHGLTIDLFNEAAARQGLQLEWVYSMEKPEDILRKHLVDLFPMGVMSPERQASRDLYLTSSWVRTETWIVWPTRLGNEVPDLAGRKLAVPSVLAYRRIAAQKYPSSILDPKATRPDVMSALCSGETTAGVMESVSLTSFLLERPPACYGVALRAEPIPGTYQSLAVFGRSEDARGLDGFRDSLNRMAQDGTIDKLYRRWGLGFSPETQLVDELNRSLQRKKQLVLAVVVLSVLLTALAFFALMLRRALVKASRATQVKADFLAVMSHEIRTPLNGIVGLSEMLKASGNMEPSQLELISSIQTCGRTLTQILNDVLDVSKLEAGKMDLEETDFDSLEPINIVMAALKQESDAKGLHITVEIDPDLPRYLRGDCIRVAQALMNLTSNAVKFAQKGSVSIHCSVDSRDADSLLVRFEVSDQGIGIPPEIQKLLFRPFIQADASTTRKFGGTGLGLTIVKQLAEQMGGSVGLESEPGRGSTIWFTAHLKDGNAPVRTGPAPATHSSLRILIAEDNPLNQQVAQALLRRLGHQTELANNGLEAVQKYLASDFDAILMDCEMPELDGYEATQRIRQHEKGSGRRTPIIALTASSLGEDRSQCLASGMDDYIPKPFTLKDLEDRLACVTH